ncbi:hypothetical protein [Bacillus subtilis]|uniref:hypothetical protein n=1 Tax=Bacillus TaxID=1386 RepID=UPI00100A0F2C|nr:hypothetical protein [Bacillus subtilis]QAV89991.1 hypothetical protein ES963_18540 [Bacillus subtilis]
MSEILLGKLQKRFKKDIQTVLVFEKLATDLKNFEEKNKTILKASNSSIDFDPQELAYNEGDNLGKDKILISIAGIKTLIVCDIDSALPNIDVLDGETGGRLFTVLTVTEDIVKPSDGLEISASELLDYILDNTISYKIIS